MRLSILFGVLTSCFLANAVAAQDRMPPLSPDKYTEAQKKAVDEFVLQRKRPLFGPFIPLIRSPELMHVLQEMGDYLNYKAPAGGHKLTEFIILITAREWTQDYEWDFHQPRALKAGVKPEIAQAIYEGRRPEGMSHEEEAVYDFVIELLHNKSVSDHTYNAVLKALGEKGVIDIAGVVGFYSTLAMVMNTTRMEVPKEGLHLPHFPH